MKSIIFHIDVSSAFLSWEAVFRLFHKGGTLDLREVPSAVGGDATLRHGIILAKSIPAKKYGIKTGETLPEAKRKCPALVLVPPNYSLYEQCSAAFMEILRDYSDVVEQYNVDEAFVDMTASCHLFGTPEGTAMQIRDRIRDELGFTVNIGVSSNKLLAKMASDFQKITLCLDNDKAGILGMEKIHRAILESPGLSGRTLDVEDNPPPVSCGKDYNSLLQKKLAGRPERGGASWQL